MIITMISTKGGVTKTTLTANVGAYLADNGSKVLMVDADIQPGLSSHYPLSRRAKNGLTHLITNVDVESVISTVDLDGIKNLDLIYSDDPDGKLQNYIIHCADGRMRLRYTLGKLRDKYDYILIDTQGAAGPLQTTAMFAADVLLSPIPVDAASAREFDRGTTRVVTNAREQGLRMGVNIGDLYAIISRMERTNDAVLMAAEIKKHLSSIEEVKLFRTVVPSKVAYKAATTHGVPVHLYDKKRTGKYPSGSEIIRDIVAEIKQLDGGL